MWLLLDHPQVAFRDCDHCQKFVYDEDTGKVETFNRGTALVERGKNNQPPCRLERGCPKGTPEQSKALNDVNWQAYEYHLQCKAVGDFPRDHIVRRNAGVIEDVLSATDRRQQARIELLLECLIAKKL